MSYQVTEAQVKQYSANVFHLSQQKASRLRNTVRNESQNAEAAFYDRIGAVDAMEKTGRHSDTQFSDTPHSRRKVTMKDFYYADLVDKEDKLRMLQDPESEYSKAAYMSLGRKIDDVVYAGLLGNAYGGKEGTTAIALPDSQKIMAVDGVAVTAQKLNLKTLKAIKKKFTKAEALDQDTDLIYITVTSEQIESLLGEDELTSADYNTVKALVAGTVDTFMGFKFIRIERMASNTSAVKFNEVTGAVGAAEARTAAIGTLKSMVAWVPSALVLAIGEDINGKVSERADKHYAKQVYASMTIGAARLEEEKVVEVYCLES